MSDDFDEIVDNMREPSTWIRVLFMAAFALLLYMIIAPVVIVMAIAQALFTVFSGDSNDNLKDMGNALSKYVFQIIQYLTYNSDLKPFPFSDFPQNDDEPVAPVKPEAPVKEDKPKAAKTTASKKPARKKTAAKKTAAKKKVKPKAAEEEGGDDAEHQE